MRLLLVSTALTVAALSLPAQAGASEVLGDPTVIEAAAGPTHAYVTLTAPTALPGGCGDGASIDVEGATGAMAVVLTPRPYKTGDFIYSFAKLPPSGHGSELDDLCSSRAIPAGDYDLAVVGTTGAERITLHLGNSAPPTLLRPELPLAAEIHDLTVTGPQGAEAGTTWFGTSGRLSGRGTVATFGWFDISTPRSTNVAYDCLSPSSEAALPTIARTSPACSGAGITDTTSGPGQRLHFTSTTNIVADEYTTGFGYVATAGADGGGAFSIFVPFAS